MASTLIDADNGGHLASGSSNFPMRAGKVSFVTKLVKQLIRRVVKLRADNIVSGKHF